MLHSGERIYTNLNLPKVTLGKDFTMAELRERIAEPESDFSGQSAFSGHDGMSVYDEQIAGMIDCLQLATEMQ